jgi:hypothetical protein
MLSSVQTKWHWDRVFSEFLNFSLTISFHRGSMLVYHLRDEQQVCWWPQFAVSPTDMHNKNCKVLFWHLPGGTEKTMEDFSQNR